MRKTEHLSEPYPAPEFIFLGEVDKSDASGFQLFNKLCKVLSTGKKKVIKYFKKQIFKNWNRRKCACMAVKKQKNLPRNALGHILIRAHSCSILYMCSINTLHKHVFGIKKQSTDFHLCSPTVKHFLTLQD